MRWLVLFSGVDMVKIKHANVSNSAMQTFPAERLKNGQLSFPIAAPTFVVPQRVALTPVKNLAARRTKPAPLDRLITLRAVRRLMPPAR